VACALKPAWILDLVDPFLEKPSADYIALQNLSTGELETIFVDAQ
jgi:hypothetical protein